MWSQTWIEEVFLRIFNLQSRPGLKKFFWESSIFNPDLDWRSFSENLQSSIRHMQLIASSRYFEGNQKWQEKLQKCKNGGFWGGTRQIDRYMYTCMYVCMYVGIKMNRIFNADTNCNNYLHIHIYVYKMAPGSNQQPWFAILNSNFEMYSVRVRNVEVYTQNLTCCNTRFYTSQKYKKFRLILSCSDTTEKSISYIWYFELYDVWRCVMWRCVNVKMCECEWRCVNVSEDVWMWAKNCQ